jgi:hypothetical protein
MQYPWVIGLELACKRGTNLTVETVEGVLERLADHYPAALHAPDRCAVQFLVHANGPARALAAGVDLWGAAAVGAGFPPADLVRAEVKTPAELEAEYNESDGPLVSHIPADEAATAIAYDATRRLLRCRTPRQVASVLSALVRQLGGVILPPDPGDPRILDLDISMGEGPPMVAAAEPYSVARLCLEEVLPGAVDDGRRAVRLLRAAAAGAANRVGAADLD